MYGGPASLPLVRFSVQVSYHLDWMYPALADLIPSRSLEVRSEVRDLFLTKLGPFVTSGASTPAQPPSKGIKL